MALLQEVTSSFLRRFRAPPASLHRIWASQCRHASTEAVAQETDELEVSSFLQAEGPTQQAIERFDPAGVAKRRNRRLPPSRYQFRSPRYYRGPLHPHQPPRPSEPSSREFAPGPFSLPRLEQTYHDTLASDYMVLAYAHLPPGQTAFKKGDRLRRWEGDSPYFKNRPLRGPRGGDTLRLLRKPVTFRNVPQLQRVTVHTMSSDAINSGAALHVSGMVLQAITNVRAEAHEVKKSVAGFGVRAGMYLSLTCELKGEDMYHFLSKLVDVVMPKMKDWPGVKGSSGDFSGNIALGLKADEVALFPEVEVNYDMYPPKLIPGCHITIHTTATTDQDARLLLTQIGIPFFGKLVN
ncbi:54S ribosomal protein L7, mitochondrial [Friedmanniomyces endolithicus]|uniref:Large ribosomal subunit protein uL5m n=1 Tax=Friedmanniomyces endolithicus TaxID=329885 RepID=A0AAN6R2N8_9PEZI|nr:54S ribosomal protein L7, mitochondrial [Friedmanniomyces endolithicus]KAK0297935.1 54S ribosomal protein L7, mitochondrial [Friedmanniomyces endolithicus]KAK0319868.1 54S ribosomal protein L7, mitochondrial [Friedmanniomyces endolithicus]KAK0921513.1 54S ribosomal protein L7, mitochondrial [Friedmanniomyces endolithicus]KAK0999761.1 54S ribosomal protein L7, mitochondrial [Friedmanniomyces endolithicus]